MWIFLPLLPTSPKYHLLAEQYSMCKNGKLCYWKLFTDTEKNLNKTELAEENTFYFYVILQKRCLISLNMTKSSLYADYKLVHDTIICKLYQYLYLDRFIDKYRYRAISTKDNKSKRFKCSLNRCIIWINDATIMGMGTEPIKYGQHGAASVIYSIYKVHISLANTCAENSRSPNYLSNLYTK